MSRKCRRSGRAAAAGEPCHPGSMWQACAHFPFSGETGDDRWVHRYRGERRQRRFRGYLAAPAGGSGPGLVIAQEIFGVNATCARSPTAMPRKAMSCWRPTCSGAWSRGVELGYSEADWQRAFGFYQRFDEAKGVEDMQAQRSPSLRARPEMPRARSARSASASAASSPISPRRAPMSIAPSAITASASRAARRGRARSSARWCCTSPSTTGSCPPRRVEKITAAPSPAVPTSRSIVYPGVDHAFAAPERRQLRQAGGADGAFAHASRCSARCWARTTISPRCGTSTTNYEFGTRATSTRRWRRWWRSPTSTTSRP